MPYQMSQVDKLAIQEDEAALQAANENLANRGKNSSFISKAFEGAMGVGAVFQQQREDSEAKAALEEIEKQGVDGLQNRFDSIGLKVNAAAFKKNIVEGYKLYKQEAERIEKEKENKEKQLKEYHSSAFKKAFLSAPTAISEEYDDIEVFEGDGFEYQGSGKLSHFDDQGRAVIKTRKTREKQLSNQDVLRMTAEKLGMPADMDADELGKLMKLRAIGEGSSGLTDKERKERAQADTAEFKLKQMKESEARINRSLLPKDTEKSNQFTKMLEKTREEFYNFRAEQAGTRALFEKIGQKGMVTGASDIAVVFSFMKSLDPRSVVREEEFQQAVNAAGRLDGLQSIANELLSGKFLSKKSMAEFVDIMIDAHNTRAKELSSKAKTLASGAALTYYQGEEGAKEKSEKIIKDFLPGTTYINNKRREEIRQEIFNDARISPEFLEKFGNQLKEAFTKNKKEGLKKKLRESGQDKKTVNASGIQGL